MDRDHSSLIIILLGGILLVLGGILFVLLVGRDMAISVGRDMAIPVMGGAFGVALVVGTLALFRAGNAISEATGPDNAPPGRAKSGRPRRIRIPGPPRLSFQHHVVASASSGFHRAVPAVTRRPPAERPELHSRDQARRFPADGAAGPTDGIRLLTRNGNDWSSRYPLIVEAMNRLKVRSCLIDGEAVAIVVAFGPS